MMFSIGMLLRFSFCSIEKLQAHNSIFWLKQIETDSSICWTATQAPSVWEGLLPNRLGPRISMVMVVRLSFLQHTRPKRGHPYFPVLEVPQTGSPRLTVRQQVFSTFQHWIGVAC